MIKNYRSSLILLLTAVGQRNSFWGNGQAHISSDENEQGIWSAFYLGNKFFSNYFFSNFSTRDIFYNIMDSLEKCLFFGCCAISMNKAKSFESQFLYHTRQKRDVVWLFQIFKMTYSLYHCYDLEKKPVKYLLQRNK